MTAGILPCRAESLTCQVAGETLVDGLTFELTAGTRTVILGPNGAGKSVTLRLLHGLAAPTGGRLVWAGPRPRERQTMVFQRPVMLRRSAAANVDFALSLKGVAGPARRQRRDRVLADTGLADIARRPARVLSAGEQQRLALARAWALAPEVLFLDEPSASLDPAATRAVEEIITRIHLSGCKIVMTTHDLGQARRLADEVMFLHRGRLVEQGAAKAFFENPTTTEARTFLAGDLLW
jgi:tungstate transport system ATP-binding protein